jgi:hypothetical protein
MNLDRLQGNNSGQNQVVIFQVSVKISFGKLIPIASFIFELAYRLSSPATNTFRHIIPLHQDGGGAR